MEDERIVALLWEKDEEGLAAAEARHGRFCRALAEHLLGSAADAEECWNDALLRAWNAIPPERPLRLRAYLARLTRGVAIDRLRALGAEKRGGGELPLVLDELAECVSGGNGTEDEAMTKALGEAVSRFLGTQSARQREMFVRRYFCGEAVGALAKRFGMKENSAAAALKRSRDALRAYLEKEDFTL